MRHFGLFVGLLTALTICDADEDIFMSWFADQKAEILDEPSNLIVEGKLPTYVKGSLLRVGPSIVTPSPNNSYSNFLDAFGRITKWEIDGEANTTTYLSSMIRSFVYNASGLDGPSPTITRHIFQEQTLPPTRPGLFSLDYMDNTDVNVYRFSDSVTGEGVGPILTFTDFHLMNAVDWGSLRTLGSVEFNDNTTTTTLPNSRARAAGEEGSAEMKTKEEDEDEDDEEEEEEEDAAALDKTFFSGSHPGEHVDTSTGEVVLVNWLGQKLPRGYRIFVYKMGADLKREVVGSVDVEHEPYSIHAVAVTGGFVALVVGPVNLRFLRTGVDLCVSCSTEDRTGLPGSSTRAFVFALEPERFLALAGAATSSSSAATSTTSTSTGAGTSTINSGSGAAPPGAKGWKLSAETPPVADVEVGAGSDSFFVFHFVNAVLRNSSSNGTELVLDTCAYDSMDGVVGGSEEDGGGVLGNLAGLADKQHRDGMRSNCDAVRRLTLSLENGGSLVARRDLAVTAVNATAAAFAPVSASPAAAGFASPTAVASSAPPTVPRSPSSSSSSLYDVRVELMSVDPRRWGRPACYMYGLTNHAGGSSRYEDVGLVKFNACLAEGEGERGEGDWEGETGSEPTATVTFSDGVYVGEPVFVGDPAGEDEDDGTLLVVSKEGASGNTALLAFDAKTMQQVARIQAPFGTMFEFHGRFFPQNTSSSAE